MEVAQSRAVSEPAEQPQSDPEPEQEPEPEPEPEVVGLTDEYLEEYFVALGSLDADRIESAAALAVPGSDAEAFPIYLAAAQRTDDGAGYVGSEKEFKRTDEGVSLCWINPETDGEECNGYGSFESEDGKLTGYDTNGLPLTGRIVLGSEKAKDLGGLGKATLIGTYKYSGGFLGTMFRVEAFDDGFFINALYTDPDGNRHEAINLVGPPGVDSGAVGYYGVVFEDPEIGGEVYVQPYSDSSSDAEGASFKAG